MIGLPPRRSLSAAPAHRQDFTPWGEVRPGGVGQTTRDFTGQRRDATGLLFYNARYYDPQLGRFLSPDTIAPAKEVPQTRNRYSYVLNNPLKYVDPSGHCFVNAQNNEERAENAACDKYIGLLSGWGMDVDLADYGNWLSEQLGAVWEGARRMSDKLGWGTDGRLFRENVLKNTSLRVRKVLDDGSAKSSCGQRAFACATWGTLVFTSLSFPNPGQPDQWAFDQRTVIHELAHVWDFRSRNELRNGLDTVLRNAADRQRDWRGQPKPGLGQDIIEDFAEAVAFYSVDDTTARGQPGFRNSSRWGYVQCVATASPDSYGLCHP